MRKIMVACTLPIGMAVLWMSSCTPAHAGDADVCYAAQAPRVTPTRTPPVQASELTSKTVFDCPRAGKHTLPELAQEGWSIVTVAPVAAAGGMRWMVVIQKR